MLQLTIAAPAPSSVIVSLTLPEGYDIVAANPEFKKRSKRSREIKWLLKEVIPRQKDHHLRTVGAFFFFPAALPCAVHASWQRQNDYHQGLGLIEDPGGHHRKKALPTEPLAKGKPAPIG